MADGDEMTPGKWGVVGGAVVLLVVAIGLIYHFSKGPEIPDIPALGDKGRLLRDETGPGTESASTDSAGSPASSAAGNVAKAIEQEEPKSIKGRKAQSESLGP
jgi:hypothetical protein